MSVTKGLVNACLIPEKLRTELREALHVEFDETINEMLAYIIVKGPTTLYRVSRDTPYSISTVYKKARRMVKDYLIRVINNGGDRCIYEVTVKGLLTCLAHGCVDDGLLLSKLCRKWRMGNYCCQRVHTLISVLPVLFKINPDIKMIIEEPEALMMCMLNNLNELRGLLNTDLLDELTRSITHYLVNRLSLNVSVIIKPSLLISNEKFAINLNPDGHVYIYTCMLCNKHCTATYLPAEDHLMKEQCILIPKIEKLMNINSI
ncbi:MAG: hypothetical protein TU36_005000 [Vulcanisaeta sp. AZ3]